MVLFRFLDLADDGSEGDAFRLAEEYGDFRALIELSYAVPNTAGAAAPKTRQAKLTTPVSVEERLEHYIEVFKEDFAFELYQFWIEKGRSNHVSVLPFAFSRRR